VLKHFAQSLRDPAFWAYSTWLGIVTHYRRSRLGPLWMFAPSVLYIWGLGWFFSRMQGRPLNEFAAHVAIGIVLFRLMSSVMTESTSILTANQAFILDGRVRITDFILRVLARGLFQVIVALPMVVLALWLHPGLQLSGFIWLFLTVPLVLFNMLWFSVLFSLIGARFPDTEQLVNNVFLFMFLLTPIIWYAEQVPLGSLRGILMYLNPLFHFIEAVRAPLLGEHINQTSMVVLVGLSMSGWALATIAYRRYSRFVPLWI